MNRLNHLRILHRFTPDWRASHGGWFLDVIKPDPEQGIDYLVRTWVIPAKPYLNISQQVQVYVEGRWDENFQSLGEPVRCWGKDLEEVLNQFFQPFGLTPDAPGEPGEG